MNKAELVEEVASQTGLTNKGSQRGSLRNYFGHHRCAGQRGKGDFGRFRKFQGKKEKAPSRKESSDRRNYSDTSEESVCVQGRQKSRASAGPYTSSPWALLKTDTGIR